jgi:hypothetical protein
MIHELGHAMLAFPDMSGIDEANHISVMNGVDPEVGTNGSTNFSYQRCDEAAAQLDWDVDSAYGEYGDCFDHITNHGTYGLRVNLTLPATSFTGCLGFAYPVSGRLEIRNHDSYFGLGQNSLGGRIVEIDRAGAAYTSVAAGGAGAPNPNWTKSLPSPASASTVSFDAHFDRASGSGIDSSSHTAFTVTWTTSPTVC